MLFVVMTPVVLALNFGISRILEYRDVAISAHEDARIFDASETMVQLVYELQLERGLSTIFVDTGGLEMFEQLLEQRRDTDVGIENATAQLSDFDVSGFDDEAQGHFKAFLQKLVGLEKFRSEISNLKVNSQDTLEFFNDINSEALAFIQHSGENSESRQISLAVHALAAFQNGKELLSMEQAMGTSAFANQGFQLPALMEFAGFLTVQDAYFDMFLEQSVEENRKVYSDFAQSENGIRLAELRELAVSKGLTGELSFDNAAIYYAAAGTYLENLAEVENALIADVRDIISAYEHEMDRAILKSALSLLAGLLLTFFLAFALVRPLRRDVESLSAAAKEMAQDNFDVSLPKASRSELGEISAAMQYLREKSIEKRELEDKIVHAEKVKVAQLERTKLRNEQASARVAREIEETSRALEMLSDTGNKSHAQLEQAHVENVSMKVRADKGNQLVQQAVRAMEQLSKSSKNISSISETIESIAFQTNLLALNARVEAARAGAAGKGFAVVAGEVQNLATRASRSASEISELVNKSREDIDRGVQVVNESGQVLQNLAAGMSKAEETAQRIRKGSEEQETALAEIRNASARLEEAMLQLIEAGTDVENPGNLVAAQ